MSVSRRWVQLGAGRARQISVGANGVPWITGCPGGNPNAPGPAEVYYLTWEQQPDNILSPFGPIPVWKYDDFNAINIYVDLNGYVFASDATGAIYCESGTATFDGAIVDLDLPGGNWLKVAESPANSFAVTACKENPVSSAPADGEMFYPSTWGYVPPGTSNGQFNIWCTGFDGSDQKPGRTQTGMRPCGSCSRQQSSIRMSSR